MLRACLLAIVAGVAACSSSSSSEPLPAAASPPAEAPATEADASAPPADAGRDATLPANGSKGCGAAGAPGVRTGLAVDAFGTKRTYVLSVPRSYDPYRAYPLVFLYHSGGRMGASARDYFAFESIGVEEKAIVVYPDGVSGSWDLDTPAAKNRDVAFFDALVSSVESEACVDTTRVFATGSSMGAYFVNQLGCRRGDVLRAIAPHAGGGPWETTGGTWDAQGHLTSCVGKPPAAMIFIGLADTNVDPGEGEKSIAHWTWANACKMQSSPRAPSPCIAWDGCARPVVACKIPGVGHRIWDQGPKATWDFFASL